MYGYLHRMAQVEGRRDMKKFTKIIGDVLFQQLEEQRKEGINKLNRQFWGLGNKGPKDENRCFKLRTAPIKISKEKVKKGGDWEVILKEKERNDKKEIRFLKKKLSEILGVKI